MTTKEKQYYALLKEYVKLCNELIDDGLPYLVVVFSHELFRFLFPYDPYAKFTHRDPVNFMIKHLKKLIKVAKEFKTTVSAYDFDLNKYDTSHWEVDTVEKSTSNMYSELWKDFDLYTLTEESLRLIKGRIPEDVIKESVVGKKAMDMGCGSGRYSIAMAKLGAKEVYGVDVQSKSSLVARKWCKKNNIPVKFKEANFLKLPFKDETFDFIFSNGTLQASRSIEKGLKELHRVLKTGAQSFLYLLAAGGFHWNTRKEIRKVFKRIPLGYTKTVLRTIGMPSNRFIFCDTWYVPLETNTTKEQLEKMLDNIGFSYRKTISRNPFDLDKAIKERARGAGEMYGDGEHRYILRKL